MGLSGIALQMLQAADTQLQSAAGQIAVAGADAPNGAGVDSVDLSAEVVALLSAKNQYSAGVSVLKLALDIQKNALDVLA